MDGKDECIFLKSENERLLDENQKLRIENTELKEKIQKYEAQLFDSGVSDSHSVNSVGRINSRDSKTSEKRVDLVQREKVTNSPEQAALYVNMKQIQGSLDQLLSVSESTPQKDVDKTSTTPEIRIAGIKAEPGVDIRGLDKVFDPGIALANALMASEIKANALRFLGKLIEAAQPVKDPAIQKVISKYRPLPDTKNI